MAEQSIGETARIMASLKRLMRARAITYGQLARRIKLSEASVKRIFSRATLSLARLDQICQALDTSIQETTRLAGEQTTDTPETLSIEQENALAADPNLLACYYLVANGRTGREICGELGVDDKMVRRWHVQLGPSAGYMNGRFARSSCSRHFQHRMKLCTSDRLNCPRNRGAYWFENSTDWPLSFVTSRNWTVHCRVATSAALVCCWQRDPGCFQCSRVCGVLSRSKQTECLMAVDSTDRFAEVSPNIPMTGPGPHRGCGNGEFRACPA
jgi:DNA-binding Xre family transcriptional regulator